MSTGSVAYIEEGSEVAEHGVDKSCLTVGLPQFLECKLAHRRDNAVNETPQTLVEERKRWEVGTERGEDRKVKSQDKRGTSLTR